MRLLSRPMTNGIGWCTLRVQRSERLGGFCEAIVDIGSPLAGYDGQPVATGLPFRS